MFLSLTISLDSFEVFSCFIRFKLLAENLLSCKIKQIQTKNEGKYISGQFKDFLTSSGIHHRLICPRTF
jgi:hypothetical protein